MSFAPCQQFRGTCQVGEGSQVHGIPLELSKVTQGHQQQAVHVALSVGSGSRESPLGGIINP